MAERSSAIMNLPEAFAVESCDLQNLWLESFREERRRSFG